MTLNEVLTEWDSLTPERRNTAMRNFLRVMSESPVSDFTGVVRVWMEEVLWEENNDYFGTEGMSL